jgi:hypothetical protein
MSTVSFRRRTLGAAVLLAALVTPAIASAGDKALAESLFQEGRRLIEKKQYEQACAKFAASEAQDPSPGTLLNLGKCHESLGKTATAWATYKEAEALARNLSRAEQEKVSADRAAGLEPKLSRLRLDPPKTPIKDLVVERSGAAVSPDTFGIDAPVDPGTYVIKASAPGYEPWTTNVTVEANADKKVVAIPDLSPTPSSTPAPHVETPVADAGSSSEGGNSRQVIGWTLTGLGGALLIGGGVMGIMTLSQASNAESDPALCPGKQCTPAGREEIDSANTKAMLANIGIGAGIVAAGAGVILLVTGGSSKSSDSPAATRVVPLIAREAAGVVVSQRF